MGVVASACAATCSVDCLAVQRLVVLAVIAFVVAGCSTSKPGGKVASPTPQTVIGTVPKEKKTIVPAQFAQGDPGAGGKVFATAGCTSCHTLKAARSHGTVGPNLDQAQPDLGLIVERVTKGMGAMPPFKGQLTDKQIADVTAYVYKSTHSQ